MLEVYAVFWFEDILGYRRYMQLFTIVASYPVYNSGKVKIANSKYKILNNCKADELYAIF